ncbi:hypothetical protein [Pseudomonas sp. AA-38]|uniref:XAC2610-related protein n=1 Tax=Pseudomonas sp. AA-38 TaxID=3028807 RepID=UPI0023F6BCD4|nr:hypothetical protein [Pseudomonas sp. AA-38]
MKTTILLLAFILPLSCLADYPEISETIAYSGNIGKQDVFMTLSTMNERVIGSYFYKKYKVPIPLSGHVLGSNLMLIEVTDKGDAHIEAELKDGVIEGEWTLNGKAHTIAYKALSKSYSTIINKIEVLYGDNSRALLVTFINGVSQKINIPVIEERTLVIFEDFTFDGYPDMRVLELEAGGNSSFIYFDYDSESKKFKPSSSEISRLVNPQVFHGEKVIVSVSKDGCCIYHAVKILPTEIRFANYDFKLKNGTETTKDKIVQGESRRSIDKKYFEENYLNFKSESDKK